MTKTRSRERLQAAVPQKAQGLAAIHSILGCAAPHNGPSRNNRALLNYDTRVYEHSRCKPSLFLNDNLLSKDVKRRGRGIV
jgi:hypothetical protein